MSAIKKISHEEAKKILDSRPDAVLFDVREEEEFAVKHADGAQVFPVDSIDEDEAKFFVPSLETPILVYCRTGFRSELAASKFEALGYKEIYDLGSMVGWPYGMAFGAY